MRLASSGPYRARNAADVRGRGGTLELPWHLSPSGLSGELLEDLLRSSGISARFLGARTEEQLLREEEEKGRKRGEGFTMLLHVYGGHWVMVYFRPGEYAIYVDSYGLPPPPNGKLREFLREKCEIGGEQVWHNARQIQAADSNYCGLFAALFALHYDGYWRRSSLSAAGKEEEEESGGKTAAEPPRYKWARKKLRDNDKRCHGYLSDLIGRGK